MENTADLQRPVRIWVAAGMVFRALSRQFFFGGGLDFLVLRVAVPRSLAPIVIERYLEFYPSGLCPAICPLIPLWTLAHWASAVASSVDVIGNLTGRAYSYVR